MSKIFGNFKIYKVIYLCCVHWTQHKPFGNFMTNMIVYSQLRNLGQEAFRLEYHCERTQINSKNKTSIPRQFTLDSFSCIVLFV